MDQSTSWHDLTGHVALVTGGNSGIGKGIARGLHKAGAAVAIWGTNADRNDDTVAELSSDGATPRCDLAGGRRHPGHPKRAGNEGQQGSGHAEHHGYGSRCLRDPATESKPDQHAKCGRTESPLS